MSSPAQKSPSKPRPANKSEYELYEDELTNYKTRSNTKLAEWHLMQAHLPDTRHALPHATEPTGQSRLHPNKHPAPIGSQEEGSSNRSVGSRSVLEVRRSYSEKISQQFEVLEDDRKSVGELQKQLKRMRQMLHELNELVNSKLNKYELVQLTPKGMQVLTEPQKQSQLLSLKIETNHKILQSLEKEIKQLQDKDKQYQQKDYLIELQQSANLLMQDIRSKKKEKVHEGVAVEKLDSRLIEIRDAALEDQYRMVKVLKHNILYYYKKFQVNKGVVEELDRNYDQLYKKDIALNDKFNRYCKVAEQRNLLVKANKSYIENKSTHDEMLAKADSLRKKIEVIKRSQMSQAERIQKQIHRMNKQIAGYQGKTVELEKISSDIATTTDLIIEKNNIGQKLISSISYKFAEVLLKQNNPKGPSHAAQNQITQELLTERQEAKKIYFKPQLKLNKSANASTELSARYRTISLGESENRQTKDSPKQAKLNDKNVATIDFQANKSSHFRIKPLLNFKKRSENDSMMKSFDIKDQAKPEEDALFKPKRFQKILSQRKQKQPS